MGKILTNLKAIREDSRMTQQELADKIGVRRETILHLENNRYNPSLKWRLKSHVSLACPLKIFSA